MFIVCAIACKQNQRYTQPLCGPQTIHHTFLLGGDKVGVMAFTFKQHCEGQRKRWGARSSVFIPLYFKAEAVRKNSHQLQILLGKNHPLFVLEVNLTFSFIGFVVSLKVCNGQVQPMSTARRPPRSTTEKGARTRCHTRSSLCSAPARLADELLRSRPSGHFDVRPSTTQVLRPAWQDQMPATCSPLERCYREFPAFFLLSSFFFLFSFSFLHLLVLDFLFILPLLFKILFLSEKNPLFSNPFKC